MKFLLLLIMSLFPLMSASAVGGRSLVIGVQQYGDPLVLVVPGGNSSFVQLKGQGLDRIGAVRVSVLSGAVTVPVPDVAARVVSKTANTAIIEVAAARGAQFNQALVELGLIGLGRGIALPPSIATIGNGLLVRPGQQSGTLAGAGRNPADLVNMGRSPSTSPNLTLSSTSRTPQGSGPLAGAGQPAGQTQAGNLQARANERMSDAVSRPGMNPPSGPSSPPATGQGTPGQLRTNPAATVAWTGVTSSTDRMSQSGGRSSQSGSSYEYYIEDNGATTEITSSYGGGHDTQIVMHTAQDGTKTTVVSKDGKQVSAKVEPPPKKDPPPQATTASPSYALDPQSADKARTLPQRSGMGNTSGNINPNPQSSGGGSTGTVTPGMLQQTGQKKGLGGDPISPTSVPAIGLPQKPMTSPSKGNIDPIPDTPSAGRPRSPGSTPAAAGSP